ncbi:MAG: hypothetical protein ACFCVD_19980 [Nodosilinea sp.]
MADFPRFRGNSAPTPAIGEVRVWVGARPRRWQRLALGLVSTGLVGGAALLGVSLRWGLLLMLDPEALPQLQARLLQPFTPSGESPTTNQAQLQQSLAAADQRLGEPIKLPSGANGGEARLVFPVLDATNGGIVALQMFRSQATADGTEALQMLSSIPIPPLARDGTLAPLMGTLSSTSAAPKTFSTTRLTQLPTPPNGSELTWLTLEGQWQQQGITLRYGQLLYFDPQRPALNLAVAWSSPTNRLPQWVDLDGDGPTDLVVDETVGLEPALRGLQVLPPTGGGVPLRPVSWLEVPVEANRQTIPYQNALRLARGGLWGQAQAELTQLKSTLANRWNPAAEAQLRLATRHAALTRQQADQDWSMPTQHILALVIDGRWEAALAKLEANPTQLEPLMRRLKTDTGRFWNRILAATTRPNPDPAVYVWGGLTLKAQQNDSAAQAWLSRQPISARQRPRLVALWQSPALAQGQSSTTADSDLPKATVTANPTADSTAPVHPLEGIIGSVTTVNSADLSRWYVPPDQSIDGSLGQWYAVEVKAVRQNQQWPSGWVDQARQFSPAELWPALAFTRMPPLTLLHWADSGETMSVSLAVRGLRMENGTLTLLATGPVLKSSTLRPLAFSAGALVWLDATQREGRVPPDAIAPLSTEIFRNSASSTGPNLALVLATVPYYTLDLTGNGQLDQVFTFDDAALQQIGAAGEGTAPKTIILSADNALIYSDLWIPQTLVALTNPQAGRPLALLVQDEGEYRLLRWSAANQRFD